MARDGNGDYSRPVTPPINGDVADADAFNAEMDDIAQALSDSLPIAGTKAMAANLPMGGFKITGLAAASANGDAVRYEQLTGLPYQAADATLTALAALSWVSGNPLMQFTAADTISLTLTPSVTSLTLSGALRVGNGSASATAVGPSATYGIFFTSGTQIDFTINGTSVWQINSSGHIIGAASRDIYLGANRRYSWVGDTDTYLENSTTDTLRLVCGGAARLTLDGSIGVFAVPVQARIPRSSETTGTLTVASANKVVPCSGGVTLPASVFTADDVVALDGNGTNRTITRGSGLTMYLNGSDVASATLAANGVGYAYYRSATVCILSGSFS